MKIEFAGASHSGAARENNEDAFAILGDKAAIVADGMGGLDKGEVASAQVVQIVRTRLELGLNAVDGLTEANECIQTLGATRANDRMGSTAVVVAINDGQALVNWVGDSRAYLYRDGVLRKLTRDHSFVEELLAVGAITETEAENHPNRHVLTRAVGIRSAAELVVDGVDVALSPGDRLLLCTDGLYGYLPELRITECLSRKATASEIVDALISLTLTETEAGDNLTAVVATIDN